MQAKQRPLSHKRARIITKRRIVLDRSFDEELARIRRAINKILYVSPALLGEVQEAKSTPLKRLSLLAVPRNVDRFGNKRND